MLSAHENAVLMRKLERYEGRVPHMYLDARGYVTVGVGHLLADLAAAQKLAFARANGSAASADDIRGDFESLLTLLGNRLAAYYRPHVRLTLPEQEIDRLTTAHISSFHRELQTIYPGFDGFPTPARLALFDLIFNVGASNLRTAWPSLNAAIRARDWAGAATHSRRAPPVSAQRNQYVRNLFEEAATVTQ